MAEPLDYQTQSGDNLANAIEADVRAGTLAQVSWVGFRVPLLLILPWTRGG